MTDGEQHSTTAEPAIAPQTTEDVAMADKDEDVQSENKSEHAEDDDDVEESQR